MADTPLVLTREADPALSRSIALLNHVFPPPRAFDVRLWDGTLLPASASARFTLSIPHAGSLRRMLRPPIELSLGEAFLRGDFGIEGDLAAAFDLVPTARAAIGSPRQALTLVALWLALPRVDEPPPVAAREPAELRGTVHSRERDRAAIRYHYDVGNDFYQLFLDRRMLYSCAYFPTGAEDLDAAQEAKLELICRKLRLRPGERLLDIGCGWGGLLIYAAQRHGVSGVGVTLSEEQHRLATARIAEAGLGDRLRVEQRDYRDLAGESFDKIVSVGMFEHVGRERLPEYFAQARRLLKPGGLFLNHGISNRPSSAARGVRAAVARAVDALFIGNYTFRRRYIFPDGELVPVSEVNLEAERAGFEVRDVENLREHYALTLRYWLERLRRRRHDAVRIAGEPVFRLWEMYLAGCIRHFDTAQINVNQTLLVRPDGGRCPLPWSRSDLYA